MKYWFLFGAAMSLIGCKTTTANKRGRAVLKDSVAYTDPTAADKGPSRGDETQRAPELQFFHRAPVVANLEEFGILIRQGKCHAYSEMFFAEFSEDDRSKLTEGRCAANHTTSGSYAAEFTSLGHCTVTTEPGKVTITTFYNGALVGDDNVFVPRSKDEATAQCGSMSGIFSEM